VLRAAGLKAAAPVILVDFLKGLVVVLAARLAFEQPLYEAAAGLGAIFGHNWSAFLRLKGGKGVATSFGVFIALLPLAAAVGFAVFVGVVAATRYVSLGSVVAAPAASATAFAMVFLGMRPSAEAVTALLVAAAVLVYRHRENIQRLRAGTERRLGRKAVA
jgi:glycerol-3-phosphate acyltransferase PlsY